MLESTLLLTASGEKQAVGATTRPLAAGMAGLQHSLFVFQLEHLPSILWQQHLVPFLHADRHHLPRLQAAPARTNCHHHAFLCLHSEKMTLGGCQQIRWVATASRESTTCAADIKLSRNMLPSISSSSWQ